MQDRPTAAELLDALREFLERDVMPILEGRVQFHTRVAVNVLGILERELTLGPALDDDERAALRALLGHAGDLRDLNVELAQRIRAGEFDDRHAELLGVLRETARAKLEIANPKYLTQ